MILPPQEIRPYHKQFFGSSDRLPNWVGPFSPSVGPAPGKWSLAEGLLHPVEEHRFSLSKVRASAAGNSLNLQTSCFVKSMRRISLE